VSDETRLGLAILGGCCLLALALCAIGLSRIVGPGLALKKRAEALREHPVFRAGPMAEIYLARINERTEELGETLGRLQLALSDLDRATRGLRSTVLTIGRVLVTLKTGLLSLRGNPHANGRF
jgi:hypothetical protein